jgi:hypothetical protein
MKKVRKFIVAITVVTIFQHGMTSRFKFGMNINSIRLLLVRKDRPDPKSNILPNTPTNEPDVDYPLYFPLIAVIISTILRLLSRLALVVPHRQNLKYQIDQKAALTSYPSIDFGAENAFCLFQRQTLTMLLKANKMQSAMLSPHMLFTS